MNKLWIVLIVVILLVFIWIRGVFNSTSKYVKVKGIIKKEEAFEYAPWIQVIETNCVFRNYDKKFYKYFNQKSYILKKLVIMKTNKGGALKYGVL